MNYSEEIEEHFNYDSAEDCFYMEISGEAAARIAGEYGDIGPQEEEILVPNKLDETYRLEIGRTGGPEEDGVTFTGVRPETADQRVLFSVSEDTLEEEALEQ